MDPKWTPEALAAAFRELARRIAQEEIQLYHEERERVKSDASFVGLIALPAKSPELRLPAPVKKPLELKAGATVYLSGPMRGYADFNYPAFFEAEAWFQRRGFTVFNPARMDQENPVDPKSPKATETYVRRDITAILKSDYIAMLLNWEQSKGATAEAAVAVWLEKPAFFQWPVTLVVSSQTKGGDFNGPWPFNLEVKSL